MSRNRIFKAFLLKINRNISKNTAVPKLLKKHISRELKPEFVICLTNIPIHPHREAPKIMYIIESAFVFLFIINSPFLALLNPKNYIIITLG